MGKGRFMKSICFPIHLLPIVERLSEQRKLSSTLAELLWEMYGECEITQEEALISSMKSEAERLNLQIQQKQNEINKKKPLKELKKRLNFIEEWLTDRAESIRFLRKNLKQGRVIISSQNDRLKLEGAQVFIQEAGSTEKLVKVYLEASQEAERLRGYILNPETVPEDLIQEFNNNNNNNNNNKQITYNNNNNNKIYYLINYYFNQSFKEMEN